MLYLISNQSIEGVTSYPVFAVTPPEGMSHRKIRRIISKVSRAAIDNMGYGGDIKKTRKELEAAGFTFHKFKRLHLCEWV